MGEIKKLILDGETVYVKKGIFGWNIVSPWKNEDGKINWFNFITGGWGSLACMGFVSLLLVLFYLAYNEAASQAAACVANNMVRNYPINLSWNFSK